MIVEDDDIIQRINNELSPQIRVWGYEVTSKSFSCYQMCDSRVYEYLMPSHCLLPPHPSTYLGKKIVEIAEEKGDLNDVKARQEEVATYWEEVDEKYIKPILSGLPEDIRTIVEKSLFQDDQPRDGLDPTADIEEPATETPAPETEQSEQKTEESGESEPFVMEPRQKATVDAIKSIKAAYLAARRAYRAPASRVERLQECLSRYVGTINFHNYTIQKAHNDPSAKRHIKSFEVNPTPIIINGTEWLSLKVHGQSFMMHQIRKMVAMATMVVRSGCHPDRIPETYGPDRIAIPKAPGLGLLLERPIFDAYNKKAEGNERSPIDFGRWETELNEFKQREIYDRIFREEEERAGYVLELRSLFFVTTTLTFITALAHSSIILITSLPNTSSTSLLAASQLLSLQLQLRLTTLAVPRLGLDLATVHATIGWHSLPLRARRMMRARPQLEAKRRVKIDAWSCKYAHKISIL